MKKWLLTLVVLAALGLAAWQFSRPEPVTVRVAEVARGRVQETVANTRVGTVEACRRARMSPSAAGQVAVLNVAAGAAVV
ncbi:MAG: efflux RND transporter periplasmic adaptor subunit, partial [Gammaproteobacteria bacterium]